MPGPSRSLCTGLLLGAAGLSCAGAGGKSLGEPPVASQAPATQGPPTQLPLHVEGLYLTQGTQRLDRSVPLIQGRGAWLRVFVTARAWAGEAPPLEAVIVDGSDRILLDRVIPGPPGGIPRAVLEAQLDHSYNLPIAGGQIQPGNRLRVRVQVPPGAPAGQLAWPADGGFAALKVVAVPPIQVTLVPVRIAGSPRVGWVTGPGRALASWRAALRRYLPLDDVRLRVAEVFDSVQNPVQEGGANRLLAQIDDLRRLHSRDEHQYFYGVFPAAQGRYTVGVSYINPDARSGRRTALGHDAAGWPSGDNYDEVFAHEMGHALGLRHAGCSTRGPIAELDPAFPYPDGRIGACGFDLEAGRPVDPGTSDLMSYCTPRWTSDYDWKKVLAFRSGEPAAPSAPAAAEEQDCLLVAGTVSGDRVRLEPAFRLHRTPEPPEPGPYQLTLLDGQGRILLATPFAVQDLAEDPAGAARFGFVLPLARDLQEQAAVLRVSRDGRVLGELQAAPRPGVAAQLPGPRGDASAIRPRARRDARGRVHLTWQAGAYPDAIVEDARTGDGLAMGAGGRLDLEGPARTLDCLFSDGLHTVERKVPVRQGRVQ